MFRVFGIRGYRHSSTFSRTPRFTLHIGFFNLQSGLFQLQKYLQEQLTRGTVTSTMLRVAHPSGCARCGAGIVCSAINYQSLLERDCIPPPLLPRRLTYPAGQTPGFGFWVSDFGFRVSGFGVRLSSFGYDLSCFEFRGGFLDFGCRKFSG